MTTKQAAEYKGVSIHTIYGWINKGKVTRPLTKKKLDNLVLHRRGRKNNPKSKELVLKSDLSVLTDYQQIVLKLRYFEDKTLQDIANRFGVSRASVKEVENRALKRLAFAKV